MRIPVLLVVLVLTELAGAIDRDVGHRARAVERDESDDVLEAVGLHLDEGLAHAGEFHLEHADRLAALEHLVCLAVVQRQRREIDLDPLAPDEIDSGAQHGQGLQAEEVELHEAGLLHPFHVELGHAHAGLRVAVERHQLLQWPVADHDAGGMGRGVPVQAFELLRDVEHALDDRLLVDGRLELRLALDGLREGDRIGRVLRHELGELVDLAVGHFEHAADVAHHAAGEQRTESDDLRDLLFAIALLHVFDDALAPLDAEVDIEIRHRHAFGIEEALEEERRSAADRDR